MIIEAKCKKCRRAGEKLFLKGDKCYTPKCVFDKRPYPPGMLFSDKKHRSMMTEYGRQLKEKQKVRNVYRLSERQFGKYVVDAASNRAMPPAERLYESLERRLDSVIFRLGFAKSRSTSRQIVSHGHIKVNGKRVNIPSYRVKVGDVISLRKESEGKPQFLIVAEQKKVSVPKWVVLDSNKLGGKISGLPKLDKTEMTYDLTSVIGFYSR